MRLYVRDHVQDKWEELADELGLDDEEKVSKELEEIKERHKTNNKKAAFEALKLWLKHNKTSVTWHKLIEALRKLELNAAVSSVRKYLSCKGKYLL